MAEYDSRADTLGHIREVQAAMTAVAAELLQRAAAHDASKLEPPEKAMFDEFTPRLADAEYGTPEYRAMTQEMRNGGLGHHYAVNDHHPEHFDDEGRGTGYGMLAEMNLLQLVEMMCDWYAAGQRPGGIPLVESVRRNAERFGYGPDIERVLLNTAGWLTAGGEDGR